MKKTIPVAFALDENYVLPTIVSITSMLENKCPDTFYDIYILENSLSEKSKEKFIWEFHAEHYALSFIPLDVQLFKQYVTCEAWPETIFARYLIPTILSKHEKCIYLDGDTLILEDLGPLYEVELADNYFGAVKSPFMNFRMAAEKESWIEIDRELFLLQCFNSGVLVMNIALMRRDNLLPVLLEETRNIASKLPAGGWFGDQDVLNKVCAAKVTYLPLKYNFYVSTEEVFSSVYPVYPFCFDKITIDEAFASPTIIHYSLDEKPWKYANAEEVYAQPFKENYRELWDQYYFLSPLGTIPLDRGKIRFKRRLHIQKERYSK